MGLQGKSKRPLRVCDRRITREDLLMQLRGFAGIGMSFPLHKQQSTLTIHSKGTSHSPSLQQRTNATQKRWRQFIQGRNFISSSLVTGCRTSKNARPSLSLLFLVNIWTAYLCYVLSRPFCAYLGICSSLCLSVRLPPQPLNGFISVAYSPQTISLNSVVLLTTRI